MTAKADVQGFSVSQFSAAVIGCGGLGCNISVHLAGMGIGRLYLIDFDTVSLSNLNRQFLYGIDDIGKPKVQSAKEKLQSFSPETEIIAIHGKADNADALEDIRNTDIVFLAVDNNHAREIAQKFCTENNIPLVNGGINGFFGTAYLYIPHQCPCLQCAGLMEKESSDIQSVSSTAGIIGALETEIGIRYLLQKKSYADNLGFLHIYDNGEINKLKIQSQANCKLCGVKK